MQSLSLPAVHDNGCYEIRLESIGGLGANLCGKLLGELGASRLGLNAAAFSSYGSEKRGSPVKSFVRLSAPERPIRVNSPVAQPHLLGIFHEALLGKAQVADGLSQESCALVNAAASPEELWRRLDRAPGQVGGVDAQGLALKLHTRINMILLGALCRASGFIPLEPALELVRATLGEKYPQMLQSNLAGVQAGYDQVQLARFEGAQRPERGGELRSDWGYANAPLGGANPQIGSTVTSDLSASREGYVPLFHPDKCIHCSLCDTTCPDMVFQFAPGQYKGRQVMMNQGLDYHHCKGCLRCVAVCPTHALTAAVERELDHLPHFRRNQALLVDRLPYEAAGANAYVTGEAYLDERRIDGGQL